MGTENKTHPSVTVVLPAHNAERYMALALESILEQTFQDFECIVIDDCSSDGTWGIIEEFARKDNRIVPLRNEVNLKMSKTLNKGIEQARGKYIARMDADDWSYPDRLQSQFSFLEAHPEVGICGGIMEVCDAELRVTGRRKYALTDADIRKKMFYFSPFSHPLVMIRKSILDQVGYYEGAYNPAEDYDLYFRLGKKSKFANLNKVLLKYRVVGQSMTTGSTKKMALMTMRIRKKYAREYGMTFPAKLYTLLQYAALHLLPAELGMKIFHFIRNS